ncbi:MAG TPA: UDP-N-acetylmuramate--L-alanine ligase, partial [Rhizobiales bacterium]|nr:UDP-N-acetylmuramate--L-alanine ligase [Hyphomicrobiales bacterium]
RNVTDGRVIAVVQPHRYSRLHDLFEEFCTCFNDADAVIVAPVFEAGEKPIRGVDHEALAEGLRRRGHRQVMSISGPDELAPVVRSVSEKGDVVLCLGAGSISQWAHALPGQLAAFDEGAGGGE